MKLLLLSITAIPTLAFTPHPSCHIHLLLSPPQTRTHHIRRAIPNNNNNSIDDDYLHYSSFKRRSLITMMAAGGGGGGNFFSNFFGGDDNNSSNNIANASTILNAGKGPTNEIVQTVNGMKLRRLGGSDILVSELGLGTQRW